MRPKAIYALFAIFSVALITRAQPQLDYAEWFVDSDPGLGNGESIEIGAKATSLNLTAEVDLASIEPPLSEGMHTLVVRVKDVPGQWSVALTRTFMIYNESAALPTPDIAALEYFIDSDPEPGQGTTLDLNDAPAIVLEEVLPKDTVGALSEGLHRLAFRALDTEGNWSVAETRQFGIRDPDLLENPDLDRVILQWLIDGSPRGDPIEIDAGDPPAMVVEIDESISTSGIEGMETAVLRIVPVDSTAQDSPLSNSGIPSFATVEFEWSDIDEDGLPDYWEDRYGFDKNIPNDPSIDTDGDGLTDGEESENDTDPSSRDTDGDFVNDRSEILLAEFGFDPLENDLDLRNEFLTDMEDAGLYSELYIRNLDLDAPLVFVDEDSGRMPFPLRFSASSTLQEDSWKHWFLNETDYLVVDGEIDLIAPKPEDDSFHRAGIAPLGPDSDFDGIPDTFEQARSHALNYLGRDDAQEDLDGNGKSNWEDYFSGYDPIIPGFSLIGVGSIPHGHVTYSAGSGYAIEALPDGAVYPIADQAAEGGYRFVDSNGKEILMTAPVSLNLGYAETGQYDFRISFESLGGTNYEQFHPEQLGDSIPPLSNGGGINFPYNSELPGWNEHPLAPNLEIVESEFPEGGIWAKGPAESDSPYLLLRQAIEIGAGGPLRSDQEISIQGSSRSDISMYVRKPDDDLELLVEGPDLFSAQLRPFQDFEPGTNYIELYSSYAVVRDTELPLLTEDFEVYAKGDSGVELGSSGYEGYPNQDWYVTDATLTEVPNGNAVPGGAGSPAQNGQILFLSSNENSYFLFSSSAIFYPDIQFEATIGVPATDNDAIEVWFRSNIRTVDSLSGYFFFISGGGIATLQNARVGLGFRDIDGAQEILVSDLDNQTLIDWDAANGMRNGTAEHWRVRVETESSRIRVWISDRGEPDAPAGPSDENLLIDIDDPNYPPGSTSGNVGVGSVSQMMWVDDIDAGQLTFQGGLKIDVGSAGVDGIQSLDTTYTKPRYVVDGELVLDRMGSGEKGDNANPSMTSNVESNWIDYVPENPLPVGGREEVIRIDVLR